MSTILEDYARNNCGRRPIWFRGKRQSCRAFSYRKNLPVACSVRRAEFRTHCNDQRQGCHFETAALFDRAAECRFLHLCRFVVSSDPATTSLSISSLKDAMYRMCASVSTAVCFMVAFRCGSHAMRFFSWRNARSAFRLGATSSVNVHESSWLRSVR